MRSGLRLCPLLFLLVPLLATAAPSRFQVGQVIVYRNPNDGTPALTGRVTKVDAEGNVWVDFKEFQPGLNAAAGSKILFKGTNQLEDWTTPAGAPAQASAPAAAAAAAPVASAAPAAPAATAAGATAPGYFLGHWSTLYVGHPVGYAPGDGFVYIKTERAAQGGRLTIRPDGSYTWETTSQGLIRGQWRAATTDELRGQFDGPGLRLLRGENGWDYTVTRRPRQSDAVPDSICIATSGYQVNAYRVQ